MALFRTFSAAIQGIDAHLVDVEVDMYPAGTSRDFVTVGMPDAAVKESRERIKSALLNSGFGYPSKSVTINLAPANVRKEGAGFDLPMATAILGAMGAVAKADDYLLVGELSLDGSLRPVRGALSIAVCAARKGIRNLLVPVENAAEAAVAEGIKVFGLRHLAEVVQFLNEPEGFTPATRVHPGSGPARSGHSRFQRRSRPDHGQARLGSCGGRQSQRTHDRAARLGQNDAGQTLRRNIAQTDVSGGARSDPDPRCSGRACRRASAFCAVGLSARRIIRFQTPG